MQDSAGPRGVPRPLSRAELIALDAVGAVAYSVVLLALDLGSTPVVQVSLPAWARMLALAAIGLPLAVRRLWPRPVFGTVVTASAVAACLGILPDAFLAAGLALYVVALTPPRRRRVPTAALGIASAAGLLVLSTVGVASQWRDQLGTAITGAVVLGGAWTLGRAVGERRVWAARSAAQLARQAVTEERLRIARELHDIVAHSIGVIAVKAGVANHVLRLRPEEAHDALRVIESTSRDALTEMRHLLGVLRAPPDDQPRPEDQLSSGGPPPSTGELLPSPSLAGLPALVDRAALVGVHVDLAVRGDGPAPDGVELAVYRIVQEALTNVMKHAAPARCQVDIHLTGDEVRVSVVDDGPGRRVIPGGHPPPTGHGLVGMRERVAVYGGAFRAGPRPAGGFEVYADLPHRRAAGPSAAPLRTGG